MMFEFDEWNPYEDRPGERKQVVQTIEGKLGPRIVRGPLSDRQIREAVDRHADDFAYHLHLLPEGEREFAIRHLFRYLAHYREEEQLGRFGRAEHVAERRLWEEDSPAEAAGVTTPIPDHKS